MKNVESSMDWLSFSDKMKQSACRLSSSACPMVLVLPNGTEIRFIDINVEMFDYKGKRGDTEYTSIGFKVNLLGAEVIDVQDDGSLANTPYVNSAKLREALVRFVRAYEQTDEMANIEATAEAYDLARAALAAPPRNCDVGTAQEQEERYIKLKREHIDRLLRCPAAGRSWLPDSLYWAQMSYEEGGDK